MDHIILKDFEVKACHGVNAEEKIMPQRFLFTVQIATDNFSAAQADNIDATVSYSAVKKRIKTVCESNCFDLIETLAYETAAMILDEFELAKSVRLTVKKPDAPMSGKFDYVAVCTERGWHKAYLALGSNLGDRAANLDFAVRRLKQARGIKNVVESERLDTEPYGGVAKGMFVNSAVMLDTYLTPQELLKIAMQIESDCGRVRVEHWGDRTLDIDILLYDDEVISSPTLIIPHPEMHLRRFVLEPLSAIAPYALHPLLNKRVSELIKDFS